MNWKNGIEILIRDGLSVKEIAQRSGLAVSSVYDIKNGNTEEPRGMAAVTLHELISSAALRAAQEKEAAHV